MSFLNKMLKQKMKDDQNFTNEQFAEYHNLKLKSIESVLGVSAETVGHSIIPFGTIADMTVGAVDMYYFPNHISGTGLTTMQLITPDGNGPKNKKGTYELIAFTKQTYNNPEQEPPTQFNQIERRICDTFTQIAGVASKKEFNPLEICQLKDNDGKNKYIIFDLYKEFKIGKQKHHLLLCIEIFEEELATIEMFGHKGFVNMLKMINIYPYSDLDRNWVGVR
ncbi:hypothetical protein CLV50_3337 [Flavobacterium lindanitolerans]|uniref:Suppressor of fused protein SUFU n=2 Tax=Flavobacterium lindanitolerans TaxID=428988 RepID=A0A497TUZ5_9FLAO|nr:hypothetical protein B0G92_3339 [Flavobacterium lindanitolerans]RLJ22971.1 hypothetical protein CLV50_3337 [Flavobacterium lindanitolerans]